MKRRTLLLTGAAALSAVGGYGLYSTLGGGSASLPGSSLILPVAAQAQSGGAGDIDLSRVEELVLGNPDAAVTVMEFASYTCPHCANFHTGVFQQLKDAYIDPGLIRFVYREVYFDAYGLWAALVARCGGQMRYFGISDMLYTEQRDWAHGANAGEVADNLRRIGRRAGLTDAQLDTCLADRDLAMAMMQVYQTGMEEHAIAGTPSFVINGQTYSNMGFDEFQRVLDPLLSEG